MIGGLMANMVQNKDTTIDLSAPASPLSITDYTFEKVLDILKDAHCQNKIGWFIETLRFIQINEILTPRSPMDPSKVLDFMEFQGFLQFVVNKFRPILPKRNRYTALDSISDLILVIGRTDFLVRFAEQLSPETIFILFCREPLRTAEDFLRFIHSPINFTEMVQNCQRKRTEAIFKD